MRSGFRARGRPRWYTALAVIAAMMAAVGLGTGGGWTMAARQATSAAAGAVPASEGEATTGHAQVIAQGLIVVPDSPAVWRVREVMLPVATQAGSHTGRFSFTLQRSGASIIRNNTTDKRARLEPGEAYFMSEGDPYTSRADGIETSTVWIFELVPPDAEKPEGKTVFTSDKLTALPKDIYDLEMTRDVVASGETVTAEPQTGAMLVLVTDGSVQTGGSGGAAPVLNAGQGLLTADPIRLRNTGTGSAVYVTVAIGAKVESPDAAPATTATAAAETGSAATATAPDRDGDGLSDADETDLGTDPDNPDTDGDGLTDKQEFNYTDPLNPDTDGDGWTDGDEELVYHTDPNDAEDHP